MKREGLRAKTARKFKAITDSKHSQPVAPNTLDRDFQATAPNQKWVGDITYIWTLEAWLYLAVVIDLFSRKVVGWSLKERMTSDLWGLTTVLTRKVHFATFAIFDRSNLHSLVTIATFLEWTQEEILDSEPSF